MSVDEEILLTDDFLGVALIGDPILDLGLDFGCGDDVEPFSLLEELFLDDNFLEEDDKEDPVVDAGLDTGGAAGRLTSVDDTEFFIADFLDEPKIGDAMLDVAFFGGNNIAAP
jgi:hypothetical protein